MKNKTFRYTAKFISYILVIIVLATTMDMPVFAFPNLPSAGIDFTLGDNTASLRDLQGEPSPRFYTPGPSITAIPTSTPGDTDDQQIAEQMTAVLGRTLKEKERELEQRREEENFKNLVIAQVRNYVNIRSLPSEEGEILGKLYNNSVGDLLSEEDGWYEIKSGSVIGYVKGEFCVTGEDAIELAKVVGTRLATVNTTTLKVRGEPSTEAIVLGLVPIEDELLVLDELGDWVKVSVEEGDGYVHADFVDLSTEFVRAESREEERIRLEREAAERRAAQAAAQRVVRQNTPKQPTEVPTVSGGGSELGIAVAQFGLQFVGNPYRYGGNSLTNGADCSGFVKAVYSHFGVSLPRTSGSQRHAGAAVEGGIANAQPGDIIGYSGHVGIYIGNGQIVHASTKETGIKISNAHYRRILAVRRVF